MRTAPTDAEHASSPSPNVTGWHLALRAALFGLAYFACSWIGDCLTLKPSLFCTFWPNSGLFLAVLLLNPARTWPALVLAAIPANLAFDLLGGRPIWVSGLFTLGNCSEALTGAWLMRRYCRNSLHIHSMRNVVALILAAALTATTLSATCGTLALTLAFDVAPLPQWLRWWSSDALGVLIVAPFILAGLRNAPDDRRKHGSRAEFATLVAMTILTSSVVMHDEFTGLQWTFLLIPLVVWTAMRFAIREVATISLVGAVTGVLMDTLLHDSAGPPHTWHSTVNLQGFFAISSILGLVLAASRSERDSAQEALQESETQLRLIFENSRDAIGVSIRGRHRFVNKAYATMFGYSSPEEILTLHVARLIAPECREQVTNYVRQRASEIDAPSHYETRGLKKDGTSFPMAVTASVYEFDGLAHSLVILRDITEQKQAAEDRLRMEQQLANLQKVESLGVLAGGIAHDFNNLLGSIFANIELALDATKEPEVRDFLTKTMIIMDPARGLTRQLLTFAKGGEPVRTLSPLFPMVKEVTLMALSGTSTRARFEIATHSGNCSYDKSQLTQVVTNIAINASQAMPHGGTLTVTAANITLGEDAICKLPAGSYVQLSFSDEGTGIPPDVLPRIFDPFFSTKPKGSGLGLAMVHSIVRKHGGALTVESTPGKGTTFHIYLPASSETPRTIAPTQAVSPNKSSGTVLIMDDDNNLSMVMGLTLKALGYKSAVTANGEEALNWLKDAQARNEPPVAALLDLTIPGGMGGVEVAAAIRQIDPSLPLIASSGYADDPAIAHPERYGFAASLEKPCHKKDLAATLARVARK